MRNFVRHLREQSADFWASEDPPEIGVLLWGSDNFTAGQKIDGFTSQVSRKLFFTTKLEIGPFFILKVTRLGARELNQRSTAGNDGEVRWPPETKADFDGRSTGLQIDRSLL